MDPTGSLWRLRTTIAEAAGVKLSLMRRLLGFVNLVRFADADARQLQDGVRESSRQPLGTFTVDGFELVRTDKVLSARNTQIMGKAALG